MEECPPSLLTITTHTQYHLPLQCKKFGRLDWLTNFVFESFLGYLKTFVKGPARAAEQIAFAFKANFILSKLNKESNRHFGHFRINENTSGSYIIKIEGADPLGEFLRRDGYNSLEILHFTRLHRANTTYHVFLYPRKGSTCSYLVSFERENVVEYGFILCFLMSNDKYFAVLQQLVRVNHFLSSYFSS